MSITENGLRCIKHWFVKNEIGSWFAFRWEGLADEDRDEDLGFGVVTISLLGTGSDNGIIIFAKFWSAGAIYRAASMLF